VYGRPAPIIPYIDSQTTQAGPRLSPSLFDGRGKQVLDPQQGAFPHGQGQQAVDVGMLAGVGAGVLAVLGVELEPARAASGVMAP
jgi:hypothetical protein